MEPEKLREFLRKGAVLVVQLTPFKENGELDLEGLRENTEFLVEKGSGKGLVIVPTGSTGEFYALLDDERRKVIETVVDVAGGKVPVIAGTGHSGTKPAIEHSKYAEDVGADGVMVVLPYYHVPEEEGLYQHYAKIAEAIDIGVLIYNNPDTSKIYIKPKLMKRIVENIPNIVGVKENTPYVGTLYKHIRTVGDKVPVLQGRGEWWFAATVFLGVRGYISGYANFMPERSLEILDAGLSGDYARLKRLIESLAPYEDFIARMSEKYGPSTTILPYPYIGSYMFFGVMKASMDIIGLHGGQMRLPLLNIDEEDKAKLAKIIFEDLGLSKVG